MYIQGTETLIGIFKLSICRQCDIVTGMLDIESKDLDLHPDSIIFIHSFIHAHIYSTDISDY